MKTISASMTDKVIAEQLFARIEARRKALGITQADMATRIDITPKTYRNLKSGSCSLMVLLSLLRQLNLLENLNELVPQPAIRPTDVWRQTQPRAGAVREPSGSISERLAARQRLKTRE